MRTRRRGVVAGPGAVLVAGPAHAAGGRGRPDLGAWVRGWRARWAHCTQALVGRDADPDQVAWARVVRATVDGAPGAVVSVRVGSWQEAVGAGVSVPGRIDGPLSISVARPGGAEAAEVRVSIEVTDPYE